MADRVRPGGATAARMTQVNPLLAPREWVQETDTGRHKTGGELGGYWNDLPYGGVGDKGDKGDKGDATQITSLMGSSVTSMTVSVGTKTITASTGKEWAIGMFVQVASIASPENYVIGQVTGYNSVSGLLSLNVGLGGNQGAGTFASWNISYAPGAGVVYDHANSHRPGGADAIPEATDSVAGLMPAPFYDKINSINATAIYVQDTQPAGMPVGAIWFSTNQQIKNPPVINSVFNQYTVANTAIDIPIGLYDDTDTTSIYLTFHSSNTTLLPLTAISTTGSGNTRNVHINGIATYGESLVTITATNGNGLISQTAFLYSVVAQAYTITASDGVLGEISPKGSITVPHGGSVVFTGVGDNGYAVDTFTVDGTPYVVSSYTFNNVVANHTIVAAFTNAFNITTTATLNGTISPSGVVPVANGHSQTFVFSPTPGFEVETFYVDGVNQNSTNGSYTFSSVTAPHTIAAVFSGLAFSITKNSGGNGTVSGPDSIAYGGVPSFTFTPSADYEVLMVTYQIGAGGSITELGSLTGYTGAAATDDITVGATFRIQLPAQVSGFTAVDAGLSTQVNLAWNASARATSYSIYWSTNSGDVTAAQIIARGNTPITQVGTTKSHTGLTQDTTYRYCIVATNTTGAAVASAVQTATPTTNVAPTSTLVWAKVALH